MALCCQLLPQAYCPALQLLSKLQSRLCEIDNLLVHSRVGNAMREIERERASERRRSPFFNLQATKCKHVDIVP